MSDQLSCAFEANPVAGRVGISFLIRNQGAEAVDLQYSTPFIDFRLEAFIDGKQVPVVKPRFDRASRGVVSRLATGEQLRISTPIQLNWNRVVGPAGEDHPTSWTVRADPSPTLLRATVRLGPIELDPCEIRVTP